MRLYYHIILQNDVGVGFIAYVGRFKHPPADAAITNAYGVVFTDVVNRMH